ncbi:MAG: hypothetical protein QOI29_5151 [Mycobacterium sp.]|nr:hypothetical protein [Mycobacterium sp.]
MCPFVSIQSAVTFPGNGFCNSAICRQRSTRPAILRRNSTGHFSFTTILPPSWVAGGSSPFGRGDRETALMDKQESLRALPSERGRYWSRNPNRRRDNIFRPPRIARLCRHPLFTAVALRAQFGCYATDYLPAHQHAEMADAIEGDSFALGVQWQCPHPGYNDVECRGQ